MEDSRRQGSSEVGRMPVCFETDGSRIRETIVDSGHRHLNGLNLVENGPWRGSIGFVSEPLGVELASLAKARL